MLLSCENRLFIDLGSGYNLSDVNGPPNIAVRYGTPDFSVAVVDQTVLQVYWNDTVIIAEQVPPLAYKEIGHDRNLARKYYLLRKITSDDQNPHRSIFGPISSGELKSELRSRGLRVEDMREFTVPAQ